MGNNVSLSTLTWFVGYLFQFCFDPDYNFFSSGILGQKKKILRHKSTHFLIILLGQSIEKSLEISDKLMQKLTKWLQMKYDEYDFISSTSTD